MADNNFLTYNNVDMPYNIEAEQAVLGAILKDTSCLHQVDVILKAECFYMPQHRDIFGVFQTLDSTNKKIDPLVVIDLLVTQGTFDKEAGKEYIMNLVSSVPTTSNVEIYATIVRDKYFLRKLIEISADTIDSATAQNDTADMILDAAEKRIYDIRQGKTSDAPSKLSDVIINNVFVTLKNITGENKDEYKGYSTGFSDLDNVLSGLNRSDLIIVGARPAMGKTSFGLNLARNISVLSNKKVLFFSLEMTKEQLAMRVLGTEARVSSHDMRSGNISTDDWQNLGKATGVLSKAELYFDDQAAITVPEMKSKIMKLGGVDCVIIDYLGLISPAVKAENRVNEVTQITKSLKAMAKELNIPIVCLAQLSRGTEARGKSHKPQLSDLRESGSIEQDADIVMLLYREDYYNSEKETPEEPEQQPEVNKVSVIVAKNRHGSTDTVDFAWDGKYTMFIPLEKVHND